MRVEIDKRSGFCFGVINAIKTAETELKEAEQLFCLGDIVHNGAEVERLETLGMKTISKEEYFRLSNCKVLIRAHGEPPETYEYARQNNIQLIDATCPVVLHLQERIKSTYQQYESQHGQMVIFGKPGHAEVEGLSGQIGNQAIVVQNKEDIEKIDFTRPIAFYSQTTKPVAAFNELAALIRARAGENVPIKIKDTICRQVANRGPHLKEFVKNFDVVIFVAGWKSSNGLSLFNLCKEENPQTYRVASAEDLDPSWFAGVESVGICGATSTPNWLMEKVAATIKERF